MATKILDDTLIPVGYQQISAPSSATGLTMIPAAEGRGVANFCLIQVLTQAVRWRDDGTDPTASVGMQIAAGKDLPYNGDLSAIKFIQEAASAEINVSYYIAK